MSEEAEPVGARRVVNPEERRIRTATNQAKRERKVRRGPKTRAQRKAATGVNKARWLADSKAVDWPENVAKWKRSA